MASKTYITYLLTAEHSRKFCKVTFYNGIRKRIQSTFPTKINMVYLICYSATIDIIHIRRNCAVVLQFYLSKLSANTELDISESKIA